MIFNRHYIEVLALSVSGACPKDPFSVEVGKRRLHNGKIKIRGLEKVRKSVILMAISINFGRLWAYFLENDPALAVLSTFAALLLAFLAKSLAEKSTGLDFGVV